VHAMAPAEPGAIEPSQDSEEKDALVPLFSIPTPTCKIGPFSTGTKSSIWGYWHLTAVCLVPVSLVLLCLCILGGGLVNIVISGIGVVVILGLVGTGKMVEVLRVMRKQLKQLKVENARLEASIAELGDKVTKLAKLQHGFEKLQELCAGNVQKAKELIQKSNTKIKMEAMAVVTHLLKHADRNKDFKLDDDETEAFVRNLELVFRGLPGFDIADLKSKMSDGMDMKKVSELVDVITAFGCEQPLGDQIVPEQ